MDKLKIKIIGWLQILGGISGLGVMGYLMLKTGTITGGVLLILLIGLALYIYSIYCGKILLENPNSKTNIILSITNQFLQLIQFMISGYGLTYIAGLQLAIGFNQDSLNFAFEIVSKFNMSINSNPSDFLFMVNLIAVVAIVYLFEQLMANSKKTKSIIQTIENQV